MKEIPFEDHGKVSIVGTGSGRQGASGTRAADPVNVQDVSLRDGFHSLFASRVRTEDMLAVVEALDKVGFHSVEVWGGAAFETALGHMNEDPWERLRALKKGFRRTPLSMLLWGKNLVGCRDYPDDVVEAFVDRACANGIDIFRVFDASNDIRNLETAAKAIKRNKKHLQGSFSHSFTETRTEDETGNLDYYLEMARRLEDMGADTICIKDTAGTMAPYEAYNLVAALKSRAKVPIHLHTHFNSGMGDLVLLKAIEAGVDIIDTCMAPLAYRSSHPAVEPLAASLRGTNRDPGFDMGLLAGIDAELEKQVAKYMQFADQTRYSVIDVNAVLHRTPDPKAREKALRDRPPTGVGPRAPELEKARREIGDLAKDMDDLLIYALSPVAGKRFLRIKYGLEKPPVDAPAASATAGGVSTGLSGGSAKVFDIDVEGQLFRVQVKEVGARAATQPIGGAAAPTAAPVAPPASPAPAAGEKLEILKAPIGGTISEIKKHVGERVRKGESVIVLDAMKMLNHIESGVDGEIVEYRVKQGDTVAKGQVLCLIRPA
jgi:pyruvate/oxaloacetate carboxyltransferase/biotin carboxyl carrier protein